MWRGKGAGSIGDLGAFSFQSSKLMTSGEGGAVITNNLEYFERVQSYINAGRRSVTDEFNHRIIGFNYRLGEFQAAVLGPQLERLPEQAKVRQENMEYFESRLAGTAGIGLLKPEPRITRLAPYGYVLKYFAEQAKDIPRAAFVAALQLEGIPCDGLFYEPVYCSSLFPLDPTDYPGAQLGTLRAARSAQRCTSAPLPSVRPIMKRSGFRIISSSAARKMSTPSSMPSSKFSTTLRNFAASSTPPSRTRASAAPTANPEAPPLRLQLKCGLS